MTTERVVLQVEMGIKDLDNRRTTDHKEYMSKVEDLIKEVTQLKTDLQKTLQTQARNSKHLINETLTIYESGFAVLQETIKGLRRSLTAKKTVIEILCLIKEIVTAPNQMAETFGGLM